jgi:hypothetical protein
MHVMGVNGKSGPVVGLVDSGADRTSLPIGYASLMGNTPQTLRTQPTMGVSGTTSALLATAPSMMVVPEIPDLVIEIWPLFVPGSQIALWGRQDFMTRFEVSLMESQKRISLTPV